MRAGEGRTESREGKVKSERERSCGTEREKEKGGTMRKVERRGGGRREKKREEKVTEGKDKERE